MTYVYLKFTRWSKKRPPDKIINNKNKYKKENKDNKHKENKN